jgi:hypothetical protein
MRQVFCFVSDCHAPFEDRKAVLLAAARIKELNPSILVFGGDILDCFLAGRFPRIGSRISKFVQELEGARWVIDTLSAAAPNSRKWFLEGNHEMRHRTAIATMGMVPGWLEGYPGIQLEEALELKARGIRYVYSNAGNASIKIGPLLFSHGSLYGATPARAELMANLCSGVSGHVHRMTEHRVTSSTSGVDWRWQTSGCLSQHAHYADRNSEQLGFVSGWLNEETNQYDMHSEKMHREGINGRVTLYTPSGTYTAYDTASGVSVQCDNYEAGSLPNRSQKTNSQKVSRKRSSQGSRKSFEKQVSIQAKRRDAKNAPR